jgi:hypothetical protein
MSSNEFYFKVKPKTNALVKAVASINLPLFSNDGAQYYAGLSIPDTGATSRQIEIDGVQISEGDPQYLSTTTVTTAGNNTISSPFNPLNNKYGFSTPEEFFAYRYGQEQPIQVNDGTDDAVSFQSIYCEWDRNKFANFVLESLVGKALTQAIAYNYFGYPVGNVNRRIDQNYDNDIKKSWGFGRMPNFGSANPDSAVPFENLSMQAGSVGGLFTIVEKNGGMTGLAGADPVQMGRQLSPKFSVENQNDDLVSRFYHMLGASRTSDTAFVKDDEFNKYYTNSHIFEIRGFPGEANLDGSKSPSLNNPTAQKPGASGVSGTPKAKSYSNEEYKDYESGKCPDTNYLTIKNNVDGNASAGIAQLEGELEGHINKLSSNANKQFDNPFQPITPTQARLWFPSMKTAMTTSPLHASMGSEAGFATTKWYYNSIDLAALEGNFIEAKELNNKSYKANFKTSNLVSMYKLIPAGVPDDKKQLYLDNPHYTLNFILPKVLEYITQVVPQNPRFAGPKPATKEPNSKTERYTSMKLEKPFYLPYSEEDFGCNELQTQRVMSGSFFEFQVGRKWINAPVLARDPRKSIPSPVSPDTVIENVNYEKIGAPEASKFQDIAPGKVGISEKWIPMIPQKNIDFSTKFGLWNNDWIGGDDTKYWQKDGSYQPKSGFGDYYAVSAGGFALLPRNPRTIASMVNSLPSYGTGRQTIAKMLEKDLPPIAITKALSDLWLSYHFATKPNGMGFSGQNWIPDLLEGISPVWNKSKQMNFEISVGFDLKINYLADSGSGDDDTIATLDGSATSFKQSNYDDMHPLLFEKEYLPESGLSDSYSHYQKYFAGTPRYPVVNYIVDNAQGWDDIANEYFAQYGPASDYQGSDVVSVQDNAYSINEKKQKVQNAIDYNKNNIDSVYKGTNVPIFVNRFSLLEFPIWSWCRGGDEGWSNLDDISWAPLIQDPQGAPADTTEYTSEIFEKWSSYLQQNPRLFGQKRKCVPNWVQSLRIYPTVKQDAAQYGLVPPNLPLSSQTFTFSADNHSSALAAAANAGAAGFGSEETDLGIYYTKEQFVIGEPGAGFAQGEAGTVEVYQKQYFSNKSTDGFGVKTYKTSNNISDSCKPYMTLNYELDNDITSENYRNNVDKPHVNLSYAVEMEIDENRMIIDLVKAGIVGLAGESSEYTDIGMDLTELFEASLYQGGANLYSDSLSKAYQSFENSLYGSESAGLSFDFGVFPTIQVVDNISYEAAQAALKAMGKISEKIEQSKTLYSDIENVPKVNAPVSSYIWDKGLPKEVAIYTKPGSGSRILGYIDNFTTVKVLKEWVNGEGKWNRIQIIDPEAGEMDREIGFIHPKHLEPVEKGLFFSTPYKSGGKGIYDNPPTVLDLAKIIIKPMSDMSRALAPTWWKLEEPYYHLEDGEYWISVELTGESCVVDDSDLEEKKKVAEKIGIKNLFDFYGKSYNEKDIDNMADAYLVTSVEDYHLDLRPGSSIKFLVKVGGIYLNAFQTVEKSLKTLRDQSIYQITLNEQYYASHINQALFGLNRMYLEIFASKYRLVGVDLMQEMKRLEFIPTLIKKYLSINNIVLGSGLDNIIEVGMNEDYKLVYIAYKHHDKKKFELLNIGLEHFKNTLPLNNTNTMSLFYNHRLIRNPMLKWQDAIKKYFVNPKPSIVEKELDSNGYPSTPCEPLNFVLPRWEDVLGPIASALDKQLQLDPRFDLGSFQFSLNKYFPPCPKPPSGVGDTLFKGTFEVNDERFTFENIDAITAFGEAFDGENIKEYVGDWLASAPAIEDIKNKVIDLDDLQEYVLDYIDPATLYAKICKCFLDQIGIDTITVPNLEIDANAGSVGANISPNPAQSALSGENKSEIKNQSKGPKADINTDPKELEASDLICSFCMEIPDFFLRLPTTNILDELLNALLAALEFILAQLLLELVKALLDLLLQCPEITCPEGQKQVKDYGGQDLGEIFSNPDLNLPPLEDYFSECGILIDGENVTGDMVLTMMTSISNRLSSGEVLGLLGNSITDSILKVGEEEISKYPEIKIQLNNKSRIEDFFTCAGLGLPRKVLADIENDIIDKYENPELCSNLLADAKAQLAERCGVSDLFDASAQRALNFDLDKYRALADAIRKNQDMSNQLPSIFGDCVGNQGVLSGLPNPTMDHVIEQTVQQMVTPIKAAMNRDLINLQQNVLVSKNPVTDSLLDSSLPIALTNLLSNSDIDRKDLLYPAKWSAGGTNAGFTQGSSFSLKSRGVAIKATDKDGKEVLGIDDMLQTLEQNIQINKSTEESAASIKIKVDEKADIILEMLPPSKDEDGNLLYENNLVTKVKVANLFGAKDNKQTIDLTLLDENTKKIPMLLLDHLNQYPLNKNLSAPPQAQYFSELILKNIQSGNFKLNDKTIDGFKSIFQNDIYWSIWSSVMDTLAESISNAELLQEFELDPTDDILGGFNPLYIIPGLGLQFAFLELAALAAGLDGITDDLIESFYNGTYLRKQMTRLNLASSANEKKQLIDFEVVEKLVQENYDFSRFYDPNSDELGMPHYAILQGLISSLIQIFVGEMYIRGLIPLSKLPTDIVLQDDAIVELTYRNMIDYITNGPSLFEKNVSEVIEGLFKACNGASIPFVADDLEDPERGIPGIAKSQTVFGETDYRIESWKDGLRYLIKENLANPIPYIQNKLNSFTLKGSGVGIEKLNPLASVSYPLMLQVYDEPFVDGVENVSIASPSRIDLFKNGKFFFQYYYELIDWEEGDDNYIESLVNRDKRLKGILSEDNFIELISLMCGIPSLYPSNTPPVEPLLSMDGDGTVDTNNIQIELQDLFKEINFGIRWCYGAVQTDALDENGEPLIKDQVEPVKKMFDEFKDLLDINGLNIISSAKLKTGPHQEPEVNDYIDFVKETKSLMLIENKNVHYSDTVQSGDDNLTDPIFSLILPLFDQKVKINGPSSFNGGWKFLSDRSDEINYVADQFSVFTKTPYGKQVVQDIVENIASNPAYEGILSYSFPVPKMCSLVVLHSVLVASRSEPFRKAFNPTKNTIRALISQVCLLKGKQQYKNSFTDPY